MCVGGGGKDRGVSVCKRGVCVCNVNWSMMVISWLFRYRSFSFSKLKVCGKSVLRWGWGMCVCVK